MGDAFLNGEWNVDVDTNMMYLRVKKVLKKYTLKEIS